MKILVWKMREDRNYFHKTFQLLYSHGQIYLSYDNFWLSQECLWLYDHFLENVCPTPSLFRVIIITPARLQRVAGKSDMRHVRFWHIHLQGLGSSRLADHLANEIDRHPCYVRWKQTNFRRVSSSLWNHEHSMIDTYDSEKAKTRDA